MGALESGPQKGSSPGDSYAEWLVDNHPGVMVRISNGCSRVRTAERVGSERALRGMACGLSSRGYG